MSIAPFSRSRLIPSVTTSLDDIEEILKPRVKDLHKGDIFLFATHLINHRLVYCAITHGEYTDEIESTYYIGVAGSDADSFLKNSSSLGLVLDTSQVVASCRPTEVGNSPPRIVSGMRHTDPRAPIDFGVHQKFDWRDLEIFPFQLTCGAQAVERFIEEEGDKHSIDYGADLQLFYCTAMRLLRMPFATPEMSAIDKRMIEDGMRNMYKAWKKLAQLDKKIKEIMRIAQDSELYDDVVACFQSSSHRDDKRHVIHDLREQASFFARLGVLEENRVIALPDAPGLTLNVSDFIRSVQRILGDKQA